LAVNTTTKPGYAQPAIIGGFVTGVLSALPIVSAGNICCCLWVVSGGVIAAYVLQQNQSEPITPGDGAIVGLMAGLFAAVVQVVVSIPVTLLVGPMERAMVQRIMDMAGSMPPEMRDAFDRYGRNGQMGAAFFVLGRMLAFMFWLCVGAVFSTLGGLLGAAIFRKPATPGTPGVIDVTPGA
jgi:hypothetical protein